MALKKSVLKFLFDGFPKVLNSEAVVICTDTTDTLFKNPKELQLITLVIRSQSAGL
jgi:hypothetical protein